MTTAPTLDGIHHVTLSVSDLDRSIAWYGRVLGLTLVKRLEVDGIKKAMLSGPGLLLTFADHGPRAVPGAFDERRSGLDHLSFAVADHGALDAWTAHLDAQGVTCGTPTQGATGSLVAFRDPDNIALELYTRA